MDDKELMSNPGVIAAEARRKAALSPVALIVDDYVNLIFHHYWKMNRKTEPSKYFSLREALYKLREYSGISQQQLAASIGVSTARLNQIELRSGPLSVQQYEILIQFAKGYSLTRIVDYFDSLLSVEFHRVAPRRGRKPKGLSGNGTGEGGWMDVIGE